MGVEEGVGGMNMRLGIWADVGNRCEEAAGKHRIKGGNWADWGLGKLGKEHGRRIKIKEM